MHLHRNSACRRMIGSRVPPVQLLEAPTLAAGVISDIATDSMVAARVRYGTADIANDEVILVRE
eukprot:13138838-Alexandrium_andersonii.AAC.1